MTLATQPVFDVATVLVLTTLFTQFLKVFIERWWLTPADPAHDTVIQMSAIVIGIIISVVFMWAAGPITRNGALQIVVTVILGVVGSAGSVGSYHIATSLKPTAPASQSPPTSPAERQFL